MLNQIISFSLRNRGFVLIVAAALMIFGGIQLQQIPVDVFPDLDRPTVTIMTEAFGLAPEEVESLVTRPIESSLNGATGVKRVRSASGIGLSIVWVEFEWGTDIYRDRQVVAEKLVNAQQFLPNDVQPIIAPISSLMGEILLLGVRSNQTPETLEGQRQVAMELRTLCEFDVRNRLLAINGVSQVTVMGGLLKQYQILTTPERLAAQDVSLELLVSAAEKANIVAGGGVLEKSAQESLIRISAPSLELSQIEDTPVVWRGDRAVLIRHVADVKFGGPLKRGDGSVWMRNADTPGAVGKSAGLIGGPAVILSVQKQPEANTLRLDSEVQTVLDQLQRELPSHVIIDRDLFRQATFIQTAISNVIEAVRDGGIWVVIVLFLILWNVRTSVVTLTAIPLSILVSCLIFRWMGVTINTMTLGGIAVAIGELVDDSIVDIENIFRRLRENRQLDHPRPTLEVVYSASSEIRNSIVYATLIVVLVVFPLFSMAGLEGRLFAPLGLAYLVTLLASLFVSLTVTPVLASLVLANAKIVRRTEDPRILQWLKLIVRPVVEFSLDHARGVLIATVSLALISVLAVTWMGGEFLPDFNEGSLTINVQTEPGTSLAESSRIATQMEQAIFRVPEVISIARRTGRAEQDEHAEGVNSSDLEVRLQDHWVAKPGWLNAIFRFLPFVHRWGYETQGRERHVVLDDVREQATTIPTIKVNIGQPISHRLDHIVSGVRAEIAVKVFGDDLQILRSFAHEIESLMIEVPGVVDLQVEPQIEIPQLRLMVKHAEAARFGYSAGDVGRLLETAYKGQVVSQILVDNQYFDLVVWFDESARSDPAEIAKTILDSPSGRKVALGQIAEVVETIGPNTINHEHVGRRIVASCNVAGRDVVSVVQEIKAKLEGIEQQLAALPGLFRVEYGGQFEAQQQANRRLILFGLLAVVGVFLLLINCLESWRAALQVLINIPLAAIGSVIALLIVSFPGFDALGQVPWWNWPMTWIQSTELSVAHWVGFITLIGIVSRNGIMMISHYIHLMKHEGEEFSKSMVIRGTLERLAPVVMTALTTIMGLIPLLLGSGEPGKEILHPLAVVLVGGLAVSAMLDQIVTPALFYRFGRRIYQKSKH